MLIYGVPLIVDCGIECWCDILFTDFLYPQPTKKQVSNNIPISLYIHNNYFMYSLFHIETCRFVGMPIAYVWNSYNNLTGYYFMEGLHLRMCKTVRKLLATWNITCRIDPLHHFSSQICESIYCDVSKVHPFIDIKDQDTLI